MRKAALLALVLACHAATHAPTSTPAPTIGHPLRLVGGGSEREGRVEILHDGGARVELGGGGESLPFFMPIRRRVAYQKT